MVAKVRDETLISQGVEGRGERFPIRGFRQKFQELAALEDLKEAVASRGQTSTLVRVKTSCPSRDSDAFVV